MTPVLSWSIHRHSFIAPPHFIGVPTKSSLTGARQEAGVTPSEVPDEEGIEMPGNWGEGDESPGGGREGSEDQGEGLSSLSAADKGKGKEKEVVGEETLQEE